MTSRRLPRYSNCAKPMMHARFVDEVGLFSDVSASFHMCRSLLTDSWDDLKNFTSLFELCKANDVCQVCLLR